MNFHLHLCIFYACKGINTDISFQDLKSDRKNIANVWKEVFLDGLTFVLFVFMLTGIKKIRLTTGKYRSIYLFILLHKKRKIINVMNGIMHNRSIEMVQVI